MALVYDFSFNPDYAGQSAVVVDASGSAVEGSPITLDAEGVGSLSLEEGTYSATASNAALGLGNTETAGSPNVAASIAAGGGGAVLDPGTTYLFEVNDGATLTPNSGFTSVTLDTLDGQPYNDEIPLPPGMYLARIEIDFDQPADDRLVSLRVTSPGVGDGNAVRQGPFYISSTATNATGYTVYASGPIVVSENGSISLTVATACVGAPVDPDDLVISYVELDLTPVLG